MAAYIDETYVENAIGADEQTAMATGSALTQLISAASATVAAVFFKAGHTSITATDFVKVCTMGALLPMLYSRKGIAIPDDFKMAYVGPLEFLIDSVGKGNIPDPGQTVTARDAIGGSKFTISDPDSTDTDARPNVFNGLRSVF